MYLYKNNLFEPSPFGPPSSSGVYMVVVIDPESNRKRICYIGSSKNIKERVSNNTHPYMKLFNRLQNKTVITISACMIDGYRELEIEMINHFRPLLNKHHKPKHRNE